MSQPLFNVIVNGTRVDVEPAKVKAQFSKMFRLEAAHVERVFNATPFLLRRNIPEDFASSLVKRLLAIGVAAEKCQAKPAPPASKAIRYADHGETSSDASAMHQPVDFLYNQHTRRIPFLFTGNGFSYFKIWIINLLVCVFSVGIMYPWARARSLSYICQHTYLDNNNFQCEANSKQIYLFHILWMSLLIAWVFSLLYSPIYFIGGFVFLIGLFPYYIFKCNQLRFGHILFCGLEVHPNRSLKETYISLLVWPLLLFFSAGLLIPYIAFKHQSAHFHHKSIGHIEFTFSAKLNQYLILLTPLMAAELAILVCLYWWQQSRLHAIAILMFASVCLSFLWCRVLLENLRWNYLGSKLGYFKASWKLSSYSALVLQNFLLCILSFGLYWPWAKIRLVKYKTSHLAFFANQRFGKWLRTLDES